MKEDNKTSIKVEKETNRKLNIIKAKRDDPDLDATINYLIDFEYKHKG